MKTFTSIATVSKRVMLAAAAVVLSFTAIALPLSKAAAQSNSVDMEGRVQVANVTAGDTEYHNSVSAKVDQVIKVQVWYHNQENAGSGKVAQDLRVALDLPKGQGKQQTIGVTIEGDNTNTVTDTAQVNLSLENAYLDYIEGSAKLRYNKAAYSGNEQCQTGNDPQGAPASCYETVGISDAVVDSDNGYKVRDVRPCFAYEATITVLLRVEASEVKVNKYVSEHDADHDPTNNDWKVHNSAKPGDKLDYMIRFENMGNTVLEDVVVGDNLPDYMSYVPGSTWIISEEYTGPAGTDNVYQGGIDVGDYNPGAAGYVIFTTQIDDKNVFKYCGTYTLINVGLVRPEGMNQFYNTAKTDVTIVCEQQDKAQVCNPETGEIITVPENKTDQYAPVNSTECEEQPEQTKVCNPETNKVITVPGDKAEQYAPVDSPKCEEAPAQPEQPEQPKKEVPEEIPATGPASIMTGLFGASGLAYGGYSWISSRRRVSQALNQ